MIKKPLIYAVCVFLLALCLVFSSVLAADTDAPEVISETAVFAVIEEDTPDRTGVLVSGMVSGNITYTAGSVGIAVTGADNTHGVWRYFDGTYWHDITGVSDTHALLLSGARKVIFIPDNHWHGSATIEYRGWNMTSGADMGYSDTTVGGLNTPYSTGKVVSHVTVTPVNDAPVVTDTYGTRLLEFDGEDDYAYIDGTTQLDRSFTIEMWCKWSALNNWSRLFDFGNGEPGSNVWAGVQSTNGILMFESFTGTDYLTKQSVIGQAVPTGQWMHVAAVYDMPSQRAYLYRNGVLEASAPITNDLNVVRYNNYFGRSNWLADDYFKGYMKEIRIWDTVRTPDQIMYYMNHPLAGNEPNLLAYYPAAEGDGTVLTNTASFGTLPNATISGASWIDTTSINTVVSTVENRPEQIDIKITDADGDNLTVTVVSSNPALISNDRLTWSGSDAVRTLTLCPNEGQTGTCSITIRADDGTVETAEQFGFFVYPCERGTVSLESAQYTVNENTPSLQLTISRTGGSTGEVSVDYATHDGTAEAGADYTPISGTIVFADGDTADKTITVPLPDDIIYEGDETFDVRLDNAQGGAFIGTRQAAVTITDNEVASIDAALTALSYQADGGSITGVSGFNSSTHAYNVTLPDTVSKTASITLHPVLSDANASVTANSGVILTDGAGTASVTITAEDGTTVQMYTVHFTSAPTPSPIPAPTAEPTPSPSPTPTAAPSLTPAPSPTPTTSPSPVPSAPVAAPTTKPTTAPSTLPVPSTTPVPTAAPTTKPAEAPSPSPAPSAASTQTDSNPTVRYGSITGTLLTGDGSPIADAHIELHSDVMCTRTDKHGRFCFTDVPLTNHTLYVLDRSGKTVSELPLSFEQADRFDITRKDNGAIVRITADTITIDVTLIADENLSNVRIENIQVSGAVQGVSYWWLIIPAALVLAVLILILFKRRRNKEDK